MNRFSSLFYSLWIEDIEKAQSFIEIGTEQELTLSDTFPIPNWSRPRDWLQISMAMGANKSFNCRIISNPFAVNCYRMERQRSSNVNCLVIWEFKLFAELFSTFFQLRIEKWLRNVRTFSMWIVKLFSNGSRLRDNLGRLKAVESETSHREENPLKKEEVSCKEAAKEKRHSHSLHPLILL